MAATKLDLSHESLGDIAYVQRIFNLSTSQAVERCCKTYADTIRLPGGYCMIIHIPNGEQRKLIPMISNFWARLKYFLS